MKTRRAHFTLLETLIAVALAVVILSTLAFFYREIDWINTEMEKVQAEGFKQRYVESRLSAILPKAVAPSKDTTDFYFFTSNDLGIDFASGSPNSLVLTFDNSFDLDKLFANHVVGKIFLDKNNRLCLAKWPSPDRWIEGMPPPMKLEILRDGVKKLSFSFFVAPKKKWKFDDQEDDVDRVNLAPDGTKQQQTEKDQTQKPTKQEPQATPQTPKVTYNPDPEGTWIDQWDNKFQQLPAMVKLQLTVIKEGKESVETFVFPLPNSDRQIVYNQ